MKANKLQLLGHGRRNPLVFAVRRANEVLERGAKQTGRRHGPAPKKLRAAGRTEPLPNTKRLDNYDSQNAHQFVLTVRQERQLDRMATRAVHGRRAANRAGAR